MNRKQLSSLHWLIAVVTAVAVTACASIGRPQGGPRDVDPPEFVSSIPANGATQVQKHKIDLYFNENVQLDDAFNKVIVSPVQKNNPAISANGKHVSVELKDTLLPNTTYTVDFADAIKDLNEGNILDGFAYAFSTGDSIDSLRISGMVLQAENLEPAQGILVGIYSNLSDTAISTLPFERIARTNQYGQFTIHNLKPGAYRIFALNDMNRDFHWDRSEDVAFYDTLVVPYSRAIEVTDTLRSSAGGDSLSTRPGIAYFPNDVLLTWFNEGYQSQYLKDYKRVDRRRFTLNMGAAADSLPEIAIADGPMAGRRAESWAVLRSNPTLDSLEYWISDTSVLAVDSLLLSVKYRRTDTLDQLSWKTDTLKFFYKDPTKKKKKDKKDEEADTLPKPMTFMSLRPVTSSTHDVYMPVIMEASEPIDSIDLGAVRLELQVDTVWREVADVSFEVDSLNPLFRRIVRHKWTPGSRYRLTVDSAAAVNVYGEHINHTKHEFNVKQLEEYSNLTFNIIGLDSLPAVVELLDQSDKPIRRVGVENGKAVIKYLNPGTVYARLFIDANGNGKWDTGSLADSVQPEEVYYFPKKINLKKNWDVNQDWNIYELPLDVQKPWDIRKNKPKLKKGEKGPSQPGDDEDEDDDEFSSPNQQFGRKPNNNFNSNFNRF